MAQAESTPTAVRDLVTGADTERSANQARAAAPTPSLRDGESPGKARLASRRRKSADHRYFIGGSDARIIMGDDEAAVLRLWREKRGELEPEDLSGNLVVQLGVATEELNRRWYQANSGQVLTDVQRQIRHPALRWMAATKQRGRYSRPSSCCPGHSRRKRRPRNICRSCSTICWW